MNTERTDKKPKSLYEMLAVNHALFTLAMLLALVGIYILYNLFLSRMFPLPNISGLYQETRNMQDQEFQDLNLTKYLGRNGDLTLLDQDGTVLFSSKEQEKDRYLPQTLSCIQEYYSRERLTVARLPDRSSRGVYLVSKSGYGSRGDIVVRGYLVLDQDLKILTGSMPADRDRFTREEFQYLKGQDSQGRSIYRHSYKNSQGEQRQMILWFTEPDYAAYERLYAVRDKVWLFLIPVYILIAGLSIWRVTRRAKGLLEPLNRGIINVSHGKDSGLEDYRGPEELSRIAGNFLDMERRLRQSEEKRRLLDQEKRRLLADISHDLRTPATVIRGYALALRDGIAPEDQRNNYLDVIVQKADRVSSLLSEFHEYSKLDHPQLELQKSREDVCGLAREYFAGRYQEIELKGFQLEAEIPEESIVCMLDKKLLIRCLDNLVNNAMNYNPPGTKICARVSRKGSHAEIFLADNGRGIPESMREKVFHPFITGDEARSGSHGSGLGLAIVHQIITLHGGTVCLNSPGNQWKTEFVITLPIS